jgi:hypothetical protein
MIVVYLSSSKKLNIEIYVKRTPLQEVVFFGTKTTGELRFGCYYQMYNIAVYS